MGNETWEGILCDEPVWSSPCIHGTCTSIAGFGHKCVCDNGWKGDDCGQCVPYHECPNQKDDACVMPNECHCPKDTIDDKGLCMKLHECPSNQITNNGNCEDCPNAGEVPNTDRLGCTACPLDQFTKDGKCEDCPNAGEVPSSARLACWSCPSHQIANN